MAKITIELTEKQAKLVEKMCDNELFYKIEESDDVLGYEDEIKALLLLMNGINEKRCEEYKKAFNKAKREARR